MNIIFKVSSWLRKIRHVDDSLNCRLQINHGKRERKYVDLSSPLLITGMSGTGPVFFAHQLALQALSNGYVVINSAGNNTAYAKSSAAQCLFYIMDTPDLCIIDSRDLIKLSGAPGAKESRLIVFTANESEKIRNFAAISPSFDSLVLLISQCAEQLLFVNSYSNELLSNNTENSCSIDVSFHKVRNADRYKNRVHLRDTLLNHLSYGNSQIQHAELHAAKIGHGVSIISSVNQGVQRLYCHE
jgi:hypothetical protein